MGATSAMSRWQPGCPRPARFRTDLKKHFRHCHQVLLQKRCLEWPVELLKSQNYWQILAALRSSTGTLIARFCHGTLSNQNRAVRLTPPVSSSVGAWARTASRGEE